MVTDLWRCKNFFLVESRLSIVANGIHHAFLFRVESSFTFDVCLDNMAHWGTLMKITAVNGRRRLGGGHCANAICFSVQPWAKVFYPSYTRQIATNRSAMDEGIDWPEDPILRRWFGKRKPPASTALPALMVWINDKRWRTELISTWQEFFTHTTFTECLGTTLSMYLAFAMTCWSHSTDQVRVKLPSTTSPTSGIRGTLQ